MAAASDKARFYLEQQVPELQEFAQKSIFTREEISAIAKKRSDFEHILNARGSKPADYVRYAAYEMNLDTLRKKRCKRLGVKGATTYSGQRTVFFILDRATKKFPGDMGLWMQYVEFCQKEKAGKKLAKVFTSLLRLKPREAGLWVLAAKHYAENQGDMTTARSYMQRGLRFCREERRLYLEYAKLEMVYLAKLAARRKILGLDEERKQVEDAPEDDNMMMLPEISAEDIDPEANKGVEEVNAAALERLKNAPAYTGAIPLAIFDTAMKQFKNDSDVANDFFDLVREFDGVPSAKTILDRIFAHLQSTAPDSPYQIICEAKMHTFAIAPTSVEFPAAIGEALAVVKAGVAKTSEAAQPKLAEKTLVYLLPILVQRDELDEGLVKVLEMSVKRYVRLFIEKSIGGELKLNALATSMVKEGKKAEGEALKGYLQG